MNGESRNSADKANVVMLPPLLLLIFVVAGGLLEWGAPFTSVDGGRAGDIIGIILVVVSFLLAGWAVKTFRTAGEHEDVRKPSYKIVSTGPFAFSRNPMYVSFLLLYLGVTFIFSVTWFVIVLPFLVAALYFGVIKREEHYLERKFGDEYRNYKTRVRRWL